MLFSFLVFPNVVGERLARRAGITSETAVHFLRRYFQGTRDVRDVLHCIDLELGEEALKAVACATLGLRKSLHQGLNGISYFITLQLPSHLRVSYSTHSGFAQQAARLRIQKKPTATETTVTRRIRGLANPRTEAPQTPRYTVSMGDPQHPVRKHPAP